MHGVQREFEAACWQGNPTLASTCSTRCLYIYTSTPQPLPKWGRPIYRDNAPRPRGVGDFYNVMWDPRVRRGKPQQPEKNFIECFNVRKPRTVKKRPKIVRERLPSPIPIQRTYYDGRVDNFLVELNPHLIEDEKATLDKEALLDLPCCPALDAAPESLDKWTEIFPGDLFDFDNLVVPVCEALVGQVVHRALLELMDEEELQALRTQQAKFEGIRSLEQIKLIEMKEQHDRLEAEKKALVERAEQYREENWQATNRAEAVAFASFYLAEPLKDCMDTLRVRNSFAELHNIVSTQFVPWLNALVTTEVSAQSFSRNFLDELLLDTVKQREAEYQFEQWKETQAEIARRQYNDLVTAQSLLGEDE